MSYRSNIYSIAHSVGFTIISSRGNGTELVHPRSCFHRNPPRQFGALETSVAVLSDLNESQLVRDLDGEREGREKKFARQSMRIECSGKRNSSSIPVSLLGLCIINDHDKYARSFSQVRRIDDRVDLASPGGEKNSLEGRTRSSSTCAPIGCPMKIGRRPLARLLLFEKASPLTRPTNHHHHHRRCHLQRRISIFSVEPNLIEAIGRGVHHAVEFARRINNIRSDAYH